MRVRTTVHTAFRTICRLVAAAFWLAPGLAFAQPPQQDEFVPLSELPPQDQLPAAPSSSRRTSWCSSPSSSTWARLPGVSMACSAT